MVRQQANMQAAFPKLDRPFFTLLTERLIANNFTEQRLRDSIGYLLDNFKYQAPNIADIINFDKKLKLYSHNEVIILIEDDRARFEDFHRHWIGDTMYRVKKTEVEMYGLERFLKKEK